MTREEAIAYFKRHIELYCVTGICREAEEMAIKALEQESVFDKIRAEIEQIEINGYIRDVECFRAGINVALNVIDKYKPEGSNK